MRTVIKTEIVKAGEHNVHVYQGNRRYKVGVVVKGAQHKWEYHPNVNTGVVIPRTPTLHQMNRELRALKPVYDRPIPRKAGT